MCNNQDIKKIQNDALLSDEMLENVSGGGLDKFCGGKAREYLCPICRKTKFVSHPGCWNICEDCKKKCGKQK